MHNARDAPSVNSPCTGLTGPCTGRSCTGRVGLSLEGVHEKPPAPPPPPPLLLRQTSAYKCIARGSPVPGEPSEYGRGLRLPPPPSPPYPPPSSTAAAVSPPPSADQRRRRRRHPPSSAPGSPRHRAGRWNHRTWLGTTNSDLPSA